MHVKCWYKLVQRNINYCFIRSIQMIFFRVIKLKKNWYWPCTPIFPRAITHSKKGAKDSITKQIKPVSDKYDPAEFCDVTLFGPKVSQIGPQIGLIRDCFSDHANLLTWKVSNLSHLGRFWSNLEPPMTPQSVTDKSEATELCDRNHRLRQTQRLGLTLDTSVTSFFSTEETCN